MECQSKIDVDLETILFQSKVNKLGFNIDIEYLYFNTICYRIQ